MLTTLLNPKLAGGLLIRYREARQEVGPEWGTPVGSL
jgi:hypothetical protein